MSLQPPVPMTEERAQPCRDERRGKPESGTRLERDAVADNRFRVTLGRLFVSPSGVTVRSCCHCRMLSIVESSRNRRPGSSSAMLSRS
ncbi:hypothetical protein [Mycobacterium tuberculosis]|uniref:hypothetical protein n=1 Tax=Mycobacterium tuberculosis TaxID=1773 RepID=UPI000AC8B75C